MALRFLGKDPDSRDGDSPSLWDDGDTYVLQGWRVSDPTVVAELLTAPLANPAELLRSCQRSAVHLEMRDCYMRNDPLFIAGQQGHRYDPADWDSWWRPWLDIVVATRERGVTIRRARIVSEPVSEYIRFEYDITFTNVEAGEDIRWLPRRRVVPHEEYRPA